MEEIKSALDQKECVLGFDGFFFLLGLKKKLLIVKEVSQL